MKRSIAILLIAIAFPVIMGCAEHKTTTSPKVQQQGKGFVVMELFTSQGCSSCPPADEILGKYAQKNDSLIIPLSFHVDYWNRLGWVDPFSKAAFTERQNYYASKLNVESIYTPQLVLNGKKELIGSDETGIEDAVNSFLKQDASAELSITTQRIGEGKVNINYVLQGAKAGTVLNLALVQANLTTNIRAGENSGVKLTNYNVVRDFKSIDFNTSTGNASFNFPSDARVDGLWVVAYLQDKASGKILAASKESAF
ncbi:MAG TPA: DUF1223 domain-containing protein [Ferruginibacter sp.]|nr:DUF1223 domain-containing protein [Ferruginibacter sp.]